MPARLSVPCAGHLLTKARNQARAGVPVERADVLGKKIGECDRIRMCARGIDCRLRVRHCGKCLQFLGVIPDQSQPGTNLIDKGRRRLAAVADLKRRNISLGYAELLGLLLLGQSPFGTKLAHPAPERCHAGCRFRRSIT